MEQRIRDFERIWRARIPEPEPIEIRRVPVWNTAIVILGRRCPPVEDFEDLEDDDEW
jgi:hypothetical protein